MGIVYSIICLILFLVAGFITHLGISGISMLADEVFNTLNSLSIADSGNISNNVYFFIFMLTLVQTTYISKAVSKTVDEDSVIDHFFIFCGNILLGCFLGLMYQSFPYEYLQKTIDILRLIIGIPTMVVIFGMTIYGMLKMGVLKFVTGTMVFLTLLILALVKLQDNPIGTVIIIFLGIAMMIGLSLTNPILLGIMVAFLPSIAVVLVLALIASIIPIPDVVLLVLSFALSYPLTEFCSSLLESAVESFSAAISIGIDVIFLIFSIFMIGFWLKVVVISPNSNIVEVGDDIISVADGRVKKSGFIGEDGMWQLFTNGYLEFNGEDLYYYDEFTMPWNEDKNDIRYLKMDDSVRSIKNRWFLNYKNLQGVALPAELEDISEKAFQGCDNLEGFSIPDSNSYYVCENGVLLTKDKKELVLCPNKKVDLYMPRASYNEKWYDSLLSNQTILYGCTQWNSDKPALYYSRNYDFYALADVNQDGITELFLATNDIPDLDDTILMVCVNQDGNVQCLEAMDTSTGGYFSVGDKCLISHIRIAGAEHFIIEEYSNGKVTLLYDLSSSNEDSDTNKEYFSGEEAISKSEYQRVISQYVEKSKKIQYAPIPAN